jgi:hypothetical protein
VERDLGTIGSKDLDSFAGEVLAGIHIEFHAAPNLMVLTGRHDP